MRRFAFLVGVSLGAICSQAIACSCMKEDGYLRHDRWVYEGLAHRSTIFHARVIALMPDGRAEVRIIESLKGPKAAPVLKTDSELSTCHIKFVLGEEFIYLPDNENKIDLCTRLRPSPEMLKAVREMVRQSSVTR